VTKSHLQALVSGLNILTSREIPPPNNQPHPRGVARGLEGGLIRKLPQTRGGHEARSQPTGTGVMEQEQAGPSKIAPPGPSSTGLGPAEQQASLVERRAEVNQALLSFLRAHTKIEPKFNFVFQVSQDLQIENSDIPRLYKIQKVMDALLTECEGIKSGSEATKHLKASMKEWEKNGRP